MGALVLALGTLTAGLYFGHSSHHAPLLLVLAILSAGCGVGIGFASKDVFGSIVSALATVFGGALVCAISARGKSPQGAAGDAVAYAVAASGIPLLLGVYFGTSMAIDLAHWYSDLHRMVALVGTLAVALAGGITVGRWTKNVPISLGASAFGAFVGVATGLTSHPEVAYVAPATLAVFAGAACCAFTASPAERRALGGALVCFGGLLGIGLFLGASSRVGLAWRDVPPVLFGFVTLAATTAALGASAGRAGSDLWSGLGFAVLGSTVGLIVGLSRTSVAHIVVPSLLAVLVVFGIYLLTTAREQRQAFSRVLAVFAVLVLFGAFVGYSLRESGRPDMTIGGQGASAGPGAPTAGGEGIGDAEVDMAAAPTGHLWLEGATTSFALLIKIRAPLDLPLQVYERVDKRLLFDGEALRGSEIRLSGESFKISWAASAGRDALAVTSWSRMVRQGDGWSVEGSATVLDLSVATIEGDRFVVTYSPRR